MFSMCMRKKGQDTDLQLFTESKTSAHTLFSTLLISAGAWNARTRQFKPSRARGSPGQSKDRTQLAQQGLHTTLAETTMFLDMRDKFLFKLPPSRHLKSKRSSSGKEPGDNVHLKMTPSLQSLERHPLVRRRCTLPSQRRW